jgi:hypothetical protein
MANPVAAISTDKQTYAVGETITATMTYSDPDARAVTITGTATDAEGHATQATVVINISDPVTPAVSDSASHTYTKVSDTGSVAVFTATA